jgi:hypothetical protein
MTRNSYLRMRQASEAGLISEIVRVLAKEAKQTRSQAGLRASRIAAIGGRGNEARTERTRRAQRELDLSRSPLTGER